MVGEIARIIEWVAIINPRKEKRKKSLNEHKKAMCVKINWEKVSSTVDGKKIPTSYGVRREQLNIMPNLLKNWKKDDLT